MTLFSRIDVEEIGGLLAVEKIGETLGEPYAAPEIEVVNIQTGYIACE